MDALWSAATVKLIGSGIDDADFADKLSRLVGDHDVQPPSALARARTASPPPCRCASERILPADAIRALPKGTALLLATGIGPPCSACAPGTPNPAPTASPSPPRPRSRPSPRARRRRSSDEAASVPAPTGRTLRGSTR